MKDPLSIINASSDRAGLFVVAGPLISAIAMVDSAATQRICLKFLYLSLVTILGGFLSRNFDLALAKTTPITERVSHEFRVEYFNVLDHPEFAQPTSTNGNNNIDSPTFGQITATGTFRGAAQRIGQLSARLTF